MIAKPSRLSYDVRRWESRQAKRAVKVKAQKASAAAWRAISQAVKARDMGLCQVCRQPTSSSGNPAKIGGAHHLVFRSAGGVDDLENLIWTCGQCHQDVHAHLVNLRGTASNLFVEDNR